MVGNIQIFALFGRSPAKSIIRNLFITQKLSQIEQLLGSEWIRAVILQFPGTQYSYLNLTELEICRFFIPTKWQSKLFKQINIDCRVTPGVILARGYVPLNESHALRGTYMSVIACFWPVHDCILIIPMFRQCINRLSGCDFQPPRTICDLAVNDVLQIYSGFFMWSRASDLWFSYQKNCTCTLPTRMDLKRKIQAVLSRPKKIGIVPRPSSIPSIWIWTPSYSILLPSSIFLNSCSIPVNFPAFKTFTNGKNNLHILYKDLEIGLQLRSRFWSQQWGLLLHQETSSEQLRQFENVWRSLPRGLDVGKCFHFASFVDFVFVEDVVGKWCLFIREI